MNELQKLQFDMLEVVDKICRKHKITYFLGYGTALGAVRHKGFIPWDDDLDIIMLRDEYNRFRNICIKELPDFLFFQDPYTDPTYPFPFAKIRNSNTTFIEEGIKDLDINHGVFIDVFQYDYLSEHVMERFRQRVWAELLWIYAGKFKRHTGYKKILSYIFNAFVSEKNYYNKMRKLEKNLLRYKENSSKLICFNWGARGHFSKKIYDRKAFVPIECEFEAGRFSIMKGYDSYLRTTYGAYMTFPPQEERVATHAEIIDLHIHYQNYLHRKK